MSPNEKGTIYIGAQFLFRSRDHGQSWERISPDLTTNDPEKQKQEESGGITVDNSAAEMHTSIYSISESPKNGQGHLGGHRRRQRAGHARRRQDLDQCGRQRAGTGAELLGVNGRGQPLRRRHGVRHVRPPHVRRHDAVRLQDHRLRQDLDGAAFSRAACAATRTSSRKTRSIPNVLFLGTEFGLWVSVDGGAHWAQYKGSEFPAVAVRDIVMQPQTSDLVLATHGRGIWIIDDISPLRALTPDLMTQTAVVLDGSRRSSTSTPTVVGRRATKPSSDPAVPATP